MFAVVKLLENTVPEIESLAFVYSGLNGISDKGREHLRDLAKSLLAIQNSPGTPVPEDISRDITRKATEELS